MKEGGREEEIGRRNEKNLREDGKRRKVNKK